MRRAMGAHRAAKKGPKAAAEGMALLNGRMGNREGGRRRCAWGCACPWLQMRLRGGMQVFVKTVTGKTITSEGDGGRHSEGGGAGPRCGPSCDCGLGIGKKRIMPDYGMPSFGSH